MKLILLLFILFFQLSGLCQTKITGTLIITPRAAYFQANKHFLKNDSALVITTLLNDTLIHTSIGGHLVRPILMDSITIEYNWGEQNGHKLIGEGKLYYKPIYLVFDSYGATQENLNMHFILFNKKTITIRSRFRSVLNWDYLDR